jgi:hypothetical protein
MCSEPSHIDTRDKPWSSTAVNPKPESAEFDEPWASVDIPVVADACGSPGHRLKFDAQKEKAQR